MKRRTDEKPTRPVKALSVRADLDEMERLETEDWRRDLERREPSEEARKLLAARSKDDKSHR